ncbi:hypothetical protein LSH36_187g05000 [Paralvinella palmiformis]|uniref:Uncharacterized protein n=1 Tax=Paralvinella palmiformis TaxID=53620 RepID=A0AAD9N7B2_9ANNE|nr:hypothetical protein LSH36_187g05000 [Paralvinella palmiformis]
MYIKVLMFLLRCAAVIYCHCTSRRYYKMEGKYYTNNIIVGPTARVVPVEVCRRACVLDLRCFAYQMRWSDETSTIGYCETVSFRSAGFNGTEYNSSYTLYAKSPSAWLGGRRYSTGVDDFVWAYTNTSVQDSGFTFWRSGEPTDPRDPAEPADCMRIRNGFQCAELDTMCKPKNTISSKVHLTKVSRLTEDRTIITVLVNIKGSSCCVSELLASHVFEDQYGERQRQASIFFDRELPVLVEMKLYARTVIIRKH